VRERERERGGEGGREITRDTDTYFFARSHASTHFSKIENNVKGIEETSLVGRLICRARASHEFKGYLHNAERSQDDSDSISSRGWAPSPSAASFHELLVLLRHGTYVRLARDPCAYFILAY